MPLKVAIIGRANVGKSTLFNRLAGRKIALVHDEPGVTRDRRTHLAKLYDLPLEIIDTAGFEYTSADGIEKRMWQQTQKAIAAADVILFLIDAREGLHPFDEHLADSVRQLNKKVVLLANKCEGRLQEYGIHEAYKLGFGEPLAFSAEHGIGLSDLYEALKTYAQELVSDNTDNDDGSSGQPLYMAIVGRPNVGKSTLVNALLGDERMLTGPEAGVTRDAIATLWNYQGRAVQLVDTAGLRKHSKITGDLEKMSAASTKRAVGLAQVVILVLDADGILDKQDLTIARQVLDEGRALIIAVNKWDIANRTEVLARLNDKLQTSLTQADGVPTVTISALKKENLDKLMSAVFKIFDRWNTRIPTAPLNQWFADVQSENPPPLGKNKRRIKLRYITQAKTRPPSFVIFSSNPEGLPDSYLRYLTNSLRSTFKLGGVPLRISVRKTDNPYADKAKKR
ncbi:MAG: ribosome biogenesis GTPase Der [Alphaproteobacteria bacterium]|nr:ribosome biogenesis GTPase Der [Alphaproteobacteria bacterium]